jgi:hypothetical protein
VTRTLGATLEYALGDLLEQREDTRRYWVDGVDAEEVRLSAPRRIRLQGFAWCCDHRRQWEVPTQVDFGISSVEPARLESLRFFLGDADVGTLFEHHRRFRNQRLAFHEPTRWLLEFRVPRPRDPPKPDPEGMVARVREWAGANPNRPIVGPGWQYLTREEAIRHIRTSGSVGVHVSLEKTWLDRGPALRVV